MHTLSAKVECIRDITFIQLWDIIQLFNGEHWAKVIIHCVCQVIVGCDNNAIQSFEWPSVFPYNSYLVDIRIESFGIVFTNSCNA